MKKSILFPFHTSGLVGLGIYCSLILGTSSSVLTEIPNPSVVQQKPESIPASSFIWPTQGNISQAFRKYQHEGIDIAAASGTPIFAAAAGTVVKASWDDWGLGNAIAIKHANGSVTVYGHNSRLLVRKNQQVTQGQIIAEMGSTGNSTAPHLHFEIHSNTRLAVDPLSLLPSKIAGNILSPEKPTSASKTVPQLNNSIDQASSPRVSPQLSSQPIQKETFSQKMATQCNGAIVIEGETANAFVKVCQENDQLLYVGQFKQEASQPVKLKAVNVGTSKYRADNGSFSYFVTPTGIEIWRNGIPLRSDNFYTSKRSHS